MTELNPEQIAGEPMPENDPAEPSAVQEATTQETLPAESAQTPPPKINRLKIISAVFNGLGIGFLLGILWSLNTEPVIGGVIATLSSLLALFLGLNEKFLDPLKSIRIGSFGLAAVAGIMLGLYMRINDPFTPTLRDKMDQYLDIGYDEDEARAFITNDIKADSGRVKRQTTLLFSSSVALDECDNLRGIDESYKREDIENIKSVGYLHGTWLEFVEVFLEQFEGDQVVTAMITMRNCFCPDEGGEGELKITTSKEIKELGSQNSVEEIESVLSSPDAGKSWQVIVSKIRENFPDENQRKTMYLAVIKVLTHD